MCSFDLCPQSLSLFPPVLPVQDDATKSVPALRGLVLSRVNFMASLNEQELPASSEG